MKLNILEILDSLVAYYQSTRSVGHTTTMLKGAENTDCLVIAHNRKYAEQIAGKAGISLDDLSRHRLQGLRKPLAIDNYALWLIFANSAQHIRELEDALWKKRGSSHVVLIDLLKERRQELQDKLKTEKFDRIPSVEIGIHQQIDSIETLLAQLE